MTEWHLTEPKSFWDQDLWTKSAILAQSMFATTTLQGKEAENGWRVSQGSGRIS